MVLVLSMKYLLIIMRRMYVPLCYWTEVILECISWKTYMWVSTIESIESDLMSYIIVGKWQQGAGLINHHHIKNRKLVKHYFFLLMKPYHMNREWAGPYVYSPSGLSLIMANRRWVSHIFLSQEVSPHLTECKWHSIFQLGRISHGCHTN